MKLNTLELDIWQAVKWTTLFIQTGGFHQVDEIFVFVF